MLFLITSFTSTIRVLCYWGKWYDGFKEMYTQAQHSIIFIANPVETNNVKIEYCSTERMMVDYMINHCKVKRFKALEETIYIYPVSQQVCV